jgi:calcium-dependent protein kinase
LLGSADDNVEQELGTNLDDSMYTMKSIHLSGVTDERFIQELRNEAEILKRLDHPRIVQVTERYEYMKQIFVVMELCSGGDLYSRNPYTEDEAVIICSSVLSPIAYMHLKGM